MSTITRAVGILVLALIGTSVRAACEDHDGQYNRHGCFMDEVKKMEAQVDIAYRKALEAVQDAEVLKQDQEFWRESRDGDCETKAANESILFTECQFNSTKERLGQLNMILSGECPRSSQFCIPLKQQGR
jgi:uncharacterized protein YecT (DUF1311 family)